MFHARTAVVSILKLLSFLVDRFLHHIFWCGTNFLGQLKEIPRTSQTSIILGKLEKDARDVAMSH